MLGIFSQSFYFSFAVEKSEKRIFEIQNSGKSSLRKILISNGRMFSLFRLPTSFNECRQEKEISTTSEVVQIVQNAYFHSSPQKNHINSH